MDRVEVAGPAVLHPGQTAQLTARAVDGSGTEISGLRATWSSSAVSVVAVDDAGRATGVALGEADIIATIGERSASLHVAVIPVPVATVSVTPAADTIAIGDSVMLQAATLDSAGNALRDRPITWTSSDTAIATVTGGLVRGRGIGTAMVSASAEGHTGSAPVVITTPPPGLVVLRPGVDSLFVGATLRIVASVYDLAGNPIIGAPLLWSTSDTTRASVTDSGLVTARSAGSFVVRARAGAKQGGAYLYAQHRVAAVVLPDTVPIYINAGRQLVPALVASNSALLAGRSVSWRSADTTVARVAADGLVVAVGFGTTAVTASSEGVSGSAVIQVRVPPVSAVFTTVADSSRVEPRGAIHLVANVYDSAGGFGPGTPVQWRSSDTTVARVNPGPTSDRLGVVMGVGRGQVVITASCGGFSAATTITVHLPVHHLAVDPDSVQVPVGTVAAFQATLRDSLGSILAYPVFWTGVSSDTAVVRVIRNTVPPDVLAVGPGRAVVTLTASPGGWTGSLSVDVPVRAAGLLTFAPGPYVEAAVLSAGDIYLLSTDSAGGGLPRPVTLTSGDTTLVTVTPGFLPSVSSPGATVTLHGHRPGVTRVTAASGAIVTTLFVTVRDVPPASWTITGLPARMSEGDTARLLVTVRGADQNIRPYPVSYASSDTAVLAVSPTGTLRALTTGRATVTITSGTLAQAAEVLILSAQPPLVSGSAPALLTPGVTAILTGSGFDTDPARNLVTIDGVPALVTSASATALSVVVGVASAYPCGGAHTAAVVVTSAGRLGYATVQFSSAEQRQLGVGQAVTLPSASRTCVEVPSVGSGYLVAVLNTAPSAGSHATIVATRGPQPAPPAARLLAAAGAAGPRPTPPEPFAHDLSRHLAQLERIRGLAAAAGSPVPALRAWRAMARPQASVADSSGGLTRLRVPRFDAPYCAGYTSVLARKAYEGTRVVIYEDVGAPLARQMDDRLESLGAEFDATVYGLIAGNFGDPLALDSLLDRNGRVAMLFSPAVNALGLAVFGSGCDFYPDAVAPASNVGEFLYGRVPTSGASGFDGDTRDNWLRGMRTLVVHEAKHLAAFAERLSRGGPVEDTWLEEATAMIAEELWVRPIYGVLRRGNARYAQTLFCDVRPTTQGCTGRPYAMYDHFALLYDYDRNMSLRSPLGPASPSDVSFLGSSWSLVRWVLDQSAASEATMLRSLTTETGLGGAANLAAQAGRPFADLVADWTMASYFDDLTGVVPGQAQWQLAGWNTRDIFLGMRQDFPGTFPLAFPIELTDLSAAPLAIDLLGGSARMLRLVAQPGLLSIEAQAGGPPPASVRVVMQRLY